MTTIIFRGYTINKVLTEEGNIYLSAPIFHCGIKQNLCVFFKDKNAGQNFTPHPFVSILGNFSENRGNLNVSLSDAVQTNMPDGDNWLAFFVEYFMANNLQALRIDESVSRCFISGFLEHHHFWCQLSNHNRTILKFEFGRYLPLQNPRHVIRTTSWSKGVLTNTNENFIEFRQTSFDGEYGDKYLFQYSEENKINLLNFVAIPFYKGWTEFDYRLGNDGFYKASAEITTPEGPKNWIYTLASEVEQDMPLMADRLDKLIRTFWGDCFLNNYRRHIDKITVLPIAT